MNLGEPPGIANPGDYISAVTVGVVPKGANQQYIVFAVLLGIFDFLRKTAIL